jgi:ABC-type uncharacterized transport system ATPase subunit
MVSGSISVRFEETKCTTNISMSNLPDDVSLIKRITALTKSYRTGKRAVNAVNGIDLQIEAGMFGLLGPNGAGKTTLMRILAGIVTPSSGEVRVNGHNLATEAGKQAVKSMLGYLPQELGMYPELTAAQFVDYMAILKRIDDSRARRQSVAQVLEMVGLSHEAGRKIKTLLTTSAAGHVGTLTTDKPRKPDRNLTVVSMLHLTDGIQYRLVGEDVNGYPAAERTQPGLEDEYVWLMKSSGYAVEAL